MAVKTFGGSDILFGDTGFTYSGEDYDMAAIRWTGKSVAVAQVEDGAILTYDAATTYTLTIGDIEVSVPGDTDVDTTAANLVAAAVAETHPYFAAIAWANPSAPSADITATATVAGVPFVVTLTVTGGTGTVTALSNTTPSTGPEHWDDADNWEGGVLPAVGDNVIVENSNSNINYGLNTITDDLNCVLIFKTFTGRIGLDSLRFSQGGTVSDGDAVEYREDYLEISAALIEIGKQVGPGTPAGSGRIKIDNNKAGASQLNVFATAAGAIEAFLPAMRYKAAHANADVTVLGAQGGVGVGKDFNGEESTNGNIVLRTENSGDKVFIGSGVEFTNYIQYGGTGVIDATATIATVIATGGDLEINGDYTITVLTNDGASIIDNHVKDGGDAITTLNNTSGSYDLVTSNDDRTIATLNQGRDATLLIDPNVVTVTTFNNPGDPYQMETQRVL